MKILLIIAAILTSNLGYTQKHLNSYRIAIIKTNTGTREVGFLKTADSTSIKLIIPGKKKALKKQVNNFKTINISEIETIKIKKKGAIGRSVRNGALIGFGIGLISGAISGEEFFASTEEVMLRNGIIVGSAGALTGLVIGSFSKGKKYLISGKLENYQSIRTELKKYYVN